MTPATVSLAKWWLKALVLPLATMMPAPKLVPKTAAPSSYLVIDGRWYTISDSASVEYFVESTALAVTDVSASNCQRAGGGMPPLGTYTLFYGPELTPVQLVGDPMVIQPLWDGRAVVRVTSTSGDVVCSGEVNEPEPPEPTEPPVFADDFESEAQ